MADSPAETGGEGGATLGSVPRSSTGRSIRIPLRYTDGASARDLRSALASQRKRRKISENSLVPGKDVDGTSELYDIEEILDEQ
jgi:hypothetical protein